MTDAQELTAPDAPPRRSSRWLGAMSAGFALAIVFGGTDLVTGVSAPGGRIFVVVALTAAFLLFALLGAGISPRSSSNQSAVAGIGVVALGVALAVSWSAPDTVPSPATVVTTSNESMCGDITYMDHDFVAITDQEETRTLSPDGRQKATHIQRLVPVASVKSITGVDQC
jgi:hypothetical protein